MSNKLVGYLLPSVILFTPLLFWTSTSNFFLTPKLLYIVIIIFIFLVSEAAYIIAHRSLRFSASSLTLPLVVFSLALIANLILIKEGRMEALIGRFPLYISSVILAYFASYTGSSLRKLSLVALIGSSTILAIHSLLQLTFLHSLTSLPDFMQTKAFTLTGSPVLTLSLFAVSVPTALYLIKHTTSLVERLIYSISSVVIIIAAVAYISLMLPGQELAPILLSYGNSWSITLDAMKNLRSILLGVGISNFSALYTAVKPLAVNSTPLWNITASTATSELLQLLSTTGVIGLASFLLLGSYALKGKGEDHVSRGVGIALSLSFLSFVFLPASLPLTIIFFILLGLKYQNTEPKLIHLENTSSVYIAAIVFLGLSFSMLYFFARWTLAETYMRQAQVALASNDGKTVYEKHMKAVQLFPTVTNYRVSYSSVNLTLAASISGNKDLTQADRDNVTQLVSQAVREARVATSLRSHDASTWANLGYVYKNLINVAEGAENYAVQAYAQAVALDRGNPVLRVDFGGLLYQLGSSSKEEGAKKAYLTRAIQEFQTAAQLKSDYANAYYLLGKSLESQGDLKNAVAALETAQAKLEKDSQDYTALSKELDNLKAQLPPTPATSSADAVTPETTLNPSPLPSPIPGGAIPLPSESPTPSN